jgi:hypothetical protein
VKRLALVLRMVTVLASCDSLTGPGSRLRVVALATTYTRDESDGVAVRFRVTNLTRDPVYLRRCGWIDAEALQRRGGEWIPRYGGVCPANMDMSLITLPRGHTLEGERLIRDAGQYRLRIGVTDRRSGDVRYRFVYSSTFLVE